jgi:hypothetical protein
VDEAQHLGKMASGRRLQDQTDTVKGLAKSTGAFVVLFGTYDLIPLLGLNGQVARRFASVHLPRYRCDEPNQWRDFQTAIRSFEREIQLTKSPDLIRNAEFLYRGSAGCIGILKSWLTAAYSQVLRADGGAMTKDLLQSTRLPTLVPIGLGTPMVECLSSYIHRLAWAHGLPTWVLVCREIAPRFRRQSILTSNGHCDLFGRVGMTINGNNGTAREAIAVLESLTGQTPLHSLTSLTVPGKRWGG